MKTIIALIDFTDITSQVIRHAVEIATAMKGEVILVHVVASESVMVEHMPDTGTPDESWAVSQANLLALRDGANAGEVQVTMRQFKGTVIESLTTQLPLLNPDLIVMGSHGHGTLYNMFVGTVTAEFLKHSIWPVMLIPKERSAEPETETADKDLNPPVLTPLGGPALPSFS